MSPVIEERLNKLTGLSLKSGSHSPDSTFCVMEAVAFVAGEEWSDHPVCACPVISAFMRAWNDALPTDADRDRLLKDLIPKLVGTKSTKAVERKRSLMAADWMIRVNTPAWLRLAGLTAQADRIASLPEITEMAQYPSLRAPLESVHDDAYAARAAARDAAGYAARDAARAAAWDAAWDAAWYAARDAARAAAWDAAWDAAWYAARGAARAAAWDAAWYARAAARDAAGDAAGDAAWYAARAAAGAAAWYAAGAAARAAAGYAAWYAAREKLAPTALFLQQSALELVHRMVEAKE